MEARDTRSCASDGMRFPTHLSCSVCDWTSAVSSLQNLCPACSRPILVRYEISPDPQLLADIQAREATSRRYIEVLPLEAEELLTLGEGVTPLLHCRRVGMELQSPNLFVKDESVNPTRSFKSRGMAVAVSMAVKLGARLLGAPTAGNAGCALAAYGARAGVPVFVAMPRDTPGAIIEECRGFGAEVELVEGLITDAARRVQERLAGSDGFDLSTLKEPYRVEGKKLMGYELLTDLGRLPDVIIYPTGGGTGLIGMWKAFDEMEQLGWIGSERPRMISVQSSGCAPIVRAFEQKLSSAPEWADARTSAWGLRVPRAVGDRLILQALYDSKGHAVAVPEESIEAAAAELRTKEASTLDRSREPPFWLSGVYSLRGWCSETRPSCSSAPAATSIATDCSGDGPAALDRNPVDPPLPLATPHRSPYNPSPENNRRCSLADNQYDVVVIGSGPGGYVAGIRAGQLGLKVAVVETDPFLGGTCLHRGCIPTKALLENAEVWHKIQKAKEFGITVGDVTLDFGGVQSRKSDVVKKNTSGIEFLFKKNKVEKVSGFGRLAGPGVVEVTAEGQDTRKLNTKNIILAMGSVPKDLPHVKADGKRILNSDHILEITEVPKSMLVIGAGAVGCEFASIFARFGTKVTVVEMLPQLLPLEDADIAKEFTRLFKKQGIEPHTEAKLEGCKVHENGVTSTITLKNGKQITVESEIVLSAVGRGPVTEGVGIEKTKIKVDRGYLQVDSHMRTAEPNVYAIGDIVPTPLLAHVASAEGILAVEQIAGLSVRPINYDHTPNATYSEPEVASVGLTEAKAKERGYEVKIGKFPFTANSKAKILGESGGLVKYVTDAKYDELLGVHIVGPRATEMIAEACTALELEATSESIARTIHAHPTLSEAMMEAAEDVHGHSIHQ